jgi:hypothetical protein
MRCFKPINQMQMSKGVNQNRLTPFVFLVWRNLVFIMPSRRFLLRFKWCNFSQNLYDVRVGEQAKRFSGFHLSIRLKTAFIYN